MCSRSALVRCCFRASTSAARNGNSRCLPLGGYVKFKGDSNASGGKDDAAMAQLSDAERRRTMNGAPLWARAATVAAGPAFNFALSILIFTGVFMLRGDVTDPLRVGELRAVPSQNELQVGDELIAINGAELPDFDRPDLFDGVPGILADAGAS